MVGVGRQHGELIAAKQRDGVSGPQHAAQSRCHLLQEAVASIMAERVVDVLESIEVEEQHAEHPLIATRGEQGLAQAVSEKAAIRETGQRVVECLVFEGVGVCLALGDVAHGGDEQVPWSDMHRADHELEREQAAVLALAHRLVRAARRQVELERPLRTGKPTMPLSPAAAAAAERADWSAATSATAIGAPDSHTFPARPSPRLYEASLAVASYADVSPPGRFHEAPKCIASRCRSTSQYSASSQSSVSQRPSSTAGAARSQPGDVTRASATAHLADCMTSARLRSRMSMITVWK